MIELFRKLWMRRRARFQVPVGFHATLSSTLPESVIDAALENAYRRKRKKGPGHS